MRAWCGPASLLGYVAGGASLAAAVWAGSMQASVAALFTSKPAIVASPPPELVPPGTPFVPVLPPLTDRQKKMAQVALWRDPLDQKLFNLFYVDAVRTRGTGRGSQEAASTLSRLGWRYTPAQQNLMLRAAVDLRFREVVDRADALMRRQKLVEQASAMLLAMEALPPVHRLVVEKLTGNPKWRYEYLRRIGPQSPATVLDARLDTMRALLRSPGGVSRVELTPTIKALAATARARGAYALWIAKYGRGRGDNLLRDDRFQIAAVQEDDDGPGPFEWRLNQGLGYSTSAGPQGVTVSWDGRGVPTFINQLVPVDAGRTYMLVIEGRSDSGRLQVLLTPTLICGTTVIGFVPVDDGRTTRFRSSLVAAGCDMADLAIGGSVDAGTRAATIDITRIILRPIG